MILSLLASLAFAGETLLPLPVVGANVVLTDCASKVVAAPWNSRRTGEVLINNARAQSICFEANGNAQIAEAKAHAIVVKSDAEAAVIVARSTAEAGLVADIGATAKQGISVSYNTNGAETHLVTGFAADWHEYGDAVTNSGVGGYGNGIINSMPIGYVDSQYAALYRLNAGQMGFAAHPAVPGATYPQYQQPVAAPAAAATVTVTDGGAALSACQAGLKVASAKLAECRSGQ